MRLKFFCQAMLIAGVLAACGGNNSSTDNTAETSSAVSLESSADGKVVQTDVVRKVSTTKSDKDLTTAQSLKEPESSTEVTSKAASKTTVSETAAQEETTTVKETQAETKAQKSEVKEAGEIGLDPSWQYASFSKINSGKSVLYKPGENGNGITIAVNAGHGTKGGSSQKTQCHPDGTPKVTSGTTKAGATTAIAVSKGMTFADGTPESTVTFEMAKILKEELLSRGYNVLMIRDGSDVQLDNIARTVIANNVAAAHIALHWDSTTADKGAFYMGVPEVDSYRSMEPVASNWKKHEALGKSLINGLSSKGTKIFSKGRMEMDLTQTSYSTIPSIDIELGDKTSDHGNDELKKLSKGLADGIDSYFGR